MVRATETLAGRYELLEVIGRGGMGVVYRARDRVLDRIVAVKVLPDELADNRILVERFEREARAAARLSHPNIVSVYDSGHDAGVRFIVMEYVPGVSLAQLMRERERLGVAESVEIAAQIASALAVAHSAGIVHRDVKPGTVMVDPEGTVKVLDFGIARATADIALTRTAMVLGSAPYIAPEAALGRSADARTDIYSLGCVLYEMLTGRPPFIGDLPAVVMNQHTVSEPQPPRELRPEIPRALDALVLRMLAKLPTDRPQSAAELVGALRATLREPEVPTAATAVVAPTAATASAPPAPPSSVDPVPPMAATAPRPRPSGPPPRRAPSRAVVALIAAVIAAAVGVAVALAVSSSSSPPRSSSTPTSRARSTPSTSQRSHSTSTSKSHSSSTSASTSSTSASTPSSSTTTTTSTTPPSTPSTSTTVP